MLPTRVFSAAKNFSPIVSLASSNYSTGAESTNLKEVLAKKKLLHIKKMLPSFENNTAKPLSAKSKSIWFTAV
jgi:hypothetical protein